ncbi:MAG: BREX system P-loop protein BrxC, partial [Thermovirga sp.]|nr:BREX system P-loop protein BrxC [Thermovirga sp.]
MMKIDEIFERRIDRIIEGVIKADDDEHLFEEIDEYVITNEINQRLSEFLDYYNDYQVVNGAWISGFFGSGKSHLLKILSYVLENRLLLDDLPAAEIFLEKLKDDALLKGQMEKAISIPSRSILFNIDQKADVVSKKETDAVLSVFMKVFNDLRGYDPKIPHIAQFEYDMDRQGCYGAFKEAFLEISGKPWEEAREYVWLEAGDFIAALSRIKGMTEEEATKTLDRYEHTYHLSIEDFASQVKDYIDNQGPGFRLNIFVDEVGQYIADNVKLMTNLQTIAESLATKCRGQAWLIVTSQEDMDDVIGEVGGRQSNDFSKIQDRLKCRMKLTSKNVAEVIQRRLLQKKSDVISDLALLYEKEKNNLKTLFEFRDSGRTYRHFQSEEDFVACYPFMPYHFELLQSAIKGLSEHNAFEGKFRSVGERSLLGVFQEVAKRIAEKKVGHLASFNLMFDGIQTALKSQIQTDILSAERTHSLQPLAVRVLKALLMVKYVREFKANPRNISILLIDRFD